jgi:hypothetical protein
MVALVLGDSLGLLSTIHWLPLKIVPVEVSIVLLSHSYYLFAQLFVKLLSSEHFSFQLYQNDIIFLSLLFHKRCIFQHLSILFEYVLQPLLAEF